MVNLVRFQKWKNWTLFSCADGIGSCVNILGLTMESITSIVLICAQLNSVERIDGLGLIALVLSNLECSAAIKSDQDGCVCSV